MNSALSASLRENKHFLCEEGGRVNHHNGSQLFTIHFPESLLQILKRLGS